MTLTCRFCAAPLEATFADLGMSPFANSYIAPEKANAMEPFYPLHAYVCSECFLVQLEAYVSREHIFDDYAYFSSYSDSWVEHAKKYANMARQRFGLTRDSLVVELASNDGYLLQHFVRAEIPVLGIEPAANVAAVAVETKKVPTLVRFFGVDTARDLVREGKRADVLIGNNVLAQVPDLNDFVAGMKILLAPRGVVTIEFPHLMRLIDGNQFDTIYHEHFSYFSLLTTQQIFAAHGLHVFDVEELTTHGGSLRIYARHAEDTSHPESAAVAALRAREDTAGYSRVETYQSFDEKVKETKRRILDFLISAKRQGKSIAGYGAPGKGNTLLNYCGIRCDFVDYTVDRNPYKHGKFLPGTHIPIFAPERIKETRPDLVLILPWNLRDEITAQLSYIRDWGGRCVVPIPEITMV